jgi:hypothetical protein
MESPLDRRNAEPQGFTDLAIRDPFQIAQDDHGLIHRREFLEGVSDQPVQLLLFKTEIELIPPVEYRPHLMMPVLFESGQIIVQEDLFGSLPLAEPAQGHIRGEAVEPRGEG